MNNKGFTLPELMVVAVLIGLVLLISITMILWGSNSFRAAEAQSILNNELRAEANYITKQIKDAWEIKILEQWDEANLSQDYNYIYLQDSKVKKKLFVVTDKSKNPPSGLEVEITELKFEKVGDKLVKFAITGTIKEGKKIREYILNSNVMADSLKYGTVVEGENGTVLMYKPKTGGE